MCCIILMDQRYCCLALQIQWHCRPSLAWGPEFDTDALNPLGLDQWSARVNCNKQKGDWRLFTAENEVDAWQGCQSGFGALGATNLCALHSHQGQGGAEEAQTHGGDHQTAAHLDVSLAQRAEDNFKTPHLLKSKVVNWLRHRSEKKSDWLISKKFINFGKYTDVRLDKKQI